MPESIATKASYHQDGNHSAIRLDSYFYISKWGPSALVEHHPYFVPSAYQPWKTMKYYIRKPIITGPKDFCINQTKTYSVSNAPAGFTWDKSSNLSISGSGASISVSATNSGTGWISVKAGSIEVARYNITVASTAPVISYIQGAEVVSQYTSYPYYIELSNYTYGVTYSWSILSGGHYIYPYGPESNYAEISFYDYWSYCLNVSASNACGSDYAYKYIWVGYSPSPPPYPNPVSDILNVEINQQMIDRAKGLQQTTGKNSNSNPVFDIRLYNDLGILMRYTTTRGGTVQIDVSSLSNGFYYLHIFDGVSGKPEMHQISVQR